VIVAGAASVLVAMGHSPCLLRDRHRRIRTGSLVGGRGCLVGRALQVSTEEANRTNATVVGVKWQDHGRNSGEPTFS
jgi:hypothetical protein